MANPSGMGVSTKEREVRRAPQGGRRPDGTRGGVRADAGRDVSECRGGGDRGGGGVVTRARREEVGRSDSRGNDAGAGSRAGGDTSDSARATEEPGVARTRISRCRTRRGAEIRRGIPDAAIGPSLVARATDTATDTTPDESANRHHVAGPRSPDDARCAPPVPAPWSLRLAARLTQDPSRRVPRLVQHHSSLARVRSAPSARHALRAEVAGTAFDTQTGCCCVLVMVGRVRRYSEKS